MLLLGESIWVCKEHSIACTCLSFCGGKVNNMSDCSRLPVARPLLFLWPLKVPWTECQHWLQISSVWKPRKKNEWPLEGFFLKPYSYGHFFTLFVSFSSCTLLWRQWMRFSFLFSVNMICSQLVSNSCKAHSWDDEMCGYVGEIWVKYSEGLQSPAISTEEPETLDEA